CVRPEGRVRGGGEGVSVESRGATFSPVKESSDGRRVLTLDLCRPGRAGDDRWCWRDAVQFRVSRLVSPSRYLGRPLGLCATGNPHRVRVAFALPAGQPPTAVPGGGRAARRAAARFR